MIRHMLKAGYLEDWEYHDTLSGTPQGGVVSPILSNIYLHELDEFVEREIIPRYTRGTGRSPNPVYKETENRLKRARAARRPGAGPGIAPPTACPFLKGPDGPRLPAAPVYKVRR